MVVLASGGESAKDGSAIAAVGATGARAETLGCGAVVTSDVTLTASLSGCEVGLVVGGDDITIDLAGHSIEAASGGSVGVDVTGRKGVVVENGSIVGFSTGVLVAGSTGASVKSLDVRGADTGIGVFGCLFSDEICSEGNTVSGNTVTGARLAGVVVSGSVGDHVRANNVTRSG